MNRIKITEEFRKAFDTLNPAQKRAVEAIEGPVLVIAGPGTGKTQMLAIRIGNILCKTDAQPRDILCLTFTEAGTIAMRERLIKFLGTEAYKIGIYTFHGFCNEILQNHPEQFDFYEYKPVTELENVHIIKKLIDDLPVSNPLKKAKGNTHYEVPRLANLFGIMKKELWDYEKIEKAVDEYLKSLPTRGEFIYKRANKKKNIKAGDIKEEAIERERKKMELLRNAAQLYGKYNEMLRDNRFYTFEDMINQVIELFKNNNNILRDYQERYLYILVDEFQDTSGSQMELLNLLLADTEQPNVFAVGDDDQSIYEFQGARIQNIVDFYTRYNPELIVLEDNYRSSQPILNAATTLIGNNKLRLIEREELNNKVGKTLIAKNPQVKDIPAKPEIIAFNSNVAELSGIIGIIQKLHEEGASYNDIAIIYRKHRLADPLIQLLQQNEIPYRVLRTINILEEPIIKHLIEILKYFNIKDRQIEDNDAQLAKLLHFKYFNISHHDFRNLMIAYRKRKEDDKDKNVTLYEFLTGQENLSSLTLQNPTHVTHLLHNLEKLLNQLGNEPFPQFLINVINELGLLEYALKAEDKEWQVQLLFSFYNFLKDELERKPDMNLNDFIITLDDLQNFNIGIPMTKVVESEEGVNLMTAHGAKGLEFDHVILMGCSTNYWEGNRGSNFMYSLPDTLTFTMEEDKVEAERRLFFVAMTRAKKSLYLTYATSIESRIKPVTRSQFIEEIKDQCSEPDQTPVINSTMPSLVDTMSQTLRPSQPEPSSLSLKHILNNYRLSPTHLNKYLKCPVTFYFENILMVPLAENESLIFGNAVHELLYKWGMELKKNNNLTIDYLKNKFTSYLMKYKYAITGNKFKDLQELGFLMIEEIRDKIPSWISASDELEKRICNSVYGDVPLKGFIDKMTIDQISRQIIVSDYKTGKKGTAKVKSAQDDREGLGGDYWRQIIFYKILIENSPDFHGFNVNEGKILYVEPDNLNKIPEPDIINISREDVNLVGQQIKEVYQNIISFQFNKGCEDARCYWCNFTREHQINMESITTELQHAMVIQP